MSGMKRHYEDTHPEEFAAPAVSLHKTYAPTFVPAVRIKTLSGTPVRTSGTMIPADAVDNADRLAAVADLLATWAQGSADAAMTLSEINRVVNHS